MRTNVAVCQEVTFAVEEVEIESRTGRIVPVRYENNEYFNARTRKWWEGTSRNPTMSPVYLFTLTDSPGYSAGAYTIRVLSLLPPLYRRTLPIRRETSL